MRIYIRSRCARGDLNSHVLRHQDLNLARLPIPPRARAPTGWVPEIIVTDSNPQTTRGTLESVPDDVTGGTGSAQKSSPFSTRVRVVQLTFLTAAVLATIGLAWWQWDRWTSGDGSFQNLGYALQWPIFGAFFIIAYRKYMEYERERLSGVEMPAAEKDEQDTPHEIPQDVLRDIDQQRNSGINDSSDNPLVDNRRRAAREAREAQLAQQASQTQDAGNNRTGR